MNELILEIESTTGFTCYEAGNALTVITKPQFTFYGTSDMFDEFKTLAGDKFRTGTIAYLIDTGASHIYSSFKNTWY